MQIDQYNALGVFKVYMTLVHVKSVMYFNAGAVGLPFDNFIDPGHVFL